jgi:hypothetical protein
MGSGRLVGGVGLGRPSRAGGQPGENNGGAGRRGSLGLRKTEGMDPSLVAQVERIRSVLGQGSFLLLTLDREKRWGRWREATAPRNPDGRQGGPFRYRGVPDRDESARRYRATVVDVTRGEGGWTLHFLATDGRRFRLRMPDETGTNLSAVAVNLGETLFSYLPDELDGRSIADL